MKLKFRQIFLIAAWIIFMAQKGSIFSSILLLASGMYTLIEVVPEIRRWHNAKR
jgi:hypothetical protein